MARFKYLGETPRPNMVKKYGPTSKVRVPCTDGTKLDIVPPNGKEFVVGEDIGVDIDDERALKCLRADSRFEEL